MNKESLLYKFFSFLKSPKYSDPIRENFLHKILDSVRIYSFMYFLIILSGIFISIALDAVNFENQDHSVIQFINNRHPLVIILLAIILGPLSEEITFRLGLKFSRFKISLSLAFLLMFIGGILTPSLFSTLTLVTYVLTYLVLFLILFIVLRFIKKDRILNFYQTYFGIIFYLSSIIFALGHIQNYTNISKVWLILPLLIFPQLLAGIVFGYIRVKFGFLYSTAMHMAYNGLTLLPILFLSLINIDMSASDSLDNLSEFQSLGLLILLLLLCGGLLTILIVNLYNLVELFYKPAKSTPLK